MPTAIAGGPSKSEFVRQFLRRNCGADRKTVEEAWLAAGHEGSISSSIVSTLRRKLGLIRKRRGSSQPVDGHGATEPRMSGETSRASPGHSQVDLRGIRPGTTLSEAPSSSTVVVQYREAMGDQPRAVEP